MINEGNKCNLESSNFLPKHQAKFFTNQKYCQIMQAKNNYCLMKNFYKRLIFCVQLRIITGSMKLIKKCETQSNVVEFFNKSNKFLVWNKNKIQFWRFDDLSHETLILEEEELVCYIKLNYNEDELILIHYNHLHFWIKNDEGIWKISQKIPYKIPLSIEFDESGNFLLLHYEVIYLLFNKGKTDGKWNYSMEFQKNRLDMLSFIDNERLAYIERLGLITIWQIYQETLSPTKLQTLKFCEYNSSASFNQQCQIRYIKSREQLFAFNQSKCYFFNKNNFLFEINRIIDFSHHPYIAEIQFYDNYLFIQHNFQVCVKMPLKILLHKLTD